MFNKFYLTLASNTIVAGVPLPRSLTLDDAVELAAWLVSLADPEQESFPSKLAEVLADE